MTNSATSIPHQPSMCTSVKKASTVVKNTTKVETLSLMLSFDAASIVALFIFFPTIRLYKNIYSFTQMEITKIKRIRGLAFTALG